MVSHYSDISQPSQAARDDVHISQPLKAACLHLKGCMPPPQRAACLHLKRLHGSTSHAGSTSLCTTCLPLEPMGSADMSTQQQLQPPQVGVVIPVLLQPPRVRAVVPVLLQPPWVGAVIPVLMGGHNGTRPGCRGIGLRCTQGHGYKTSHP